VRDVTGDSRAVVSKLLTDVWSNGNVDLLDDLIDPGYRSHIEETDPVRTSHQTGPIIPRTEIAAYRSGIPNLSSDVTTVLAEGDTVVAIWTMSGDNTADASVEDGDEVIPSSGRPIETTGVGTFIVKDGKITEAAYRWYPLGPLTQLRFFATGAVEIQLSDERVSLRR
jgi:ketosteroid isomerase-like protein